MLTFIRRFLLHVLPRGFFKVRYYGIFSSRYRKENLSASKKLLLEQQDVQCQEAIEDGIPIFQKQDTVWMEILNRIQAYQKPNCPKCRQGRPRFAGIVPCEIPDPG
jgi:hypothetical protein